MNAGSIMNRSHVRTGPYTVIVSVQFRRSNGAMNSSRSGVVIHNRSAMSALARHIKAWQPTFGLKADFRSGSDSDLTALKCDFRSTRTADIIGSVRLVGPVGANGITDDTLAASCGATITLE